MSNTQWPISLAECPLRSGYAEGQDSNTVTTNIEAGYDKSRRRYTAVSQKMSVSIDTSSAGVDSFYAFFNNEIAGGSLRFDWLHPRTRQPAVCRIRTEPAISEPVGDIYTISFTLEVLPS